MAVFRNSAVNLLMLQVGIPLSGVLVSLALILLGRFLIRPVVIGMAARWGLRGMVVGGTLLSALQYPFLAEIHGVGLVLAALIAVSAVGDTFYWTTYHAYFAALGDDEFRGHQIGVREAISAISAIAGIASPLLAGWLLVAFGPRVAFG